MMTTGDRLREVLERLTHVSGGLYRWTGYRYLGNDTWDDRPPDPVSHDSVSTSDFCAILEEQAALTDYFKPNHMAGSDYSGTLIEISNHRVFLDKFRAMPGVHEMQGDFHAHGVVIRLDCITSRMIEIFEGLRKSPVIDAAALSEMARAAESEAWNVWVRVHYEQALVSALQKTSKRPDRAIKGREDLRLIFERVASRIGEHWLHETGQNANIAVEKIAAATTPADLGLTAPRKRTLTVNH